MGLGGPWTLSGAQPGRNLLLGQHGPPHRGQSWGWEKCQNQIREGRKVRAFKQKPGASSSPLAETQRTSQDPLTSVWAPLRQLGSSGMARQFPVPTWFRPDLRALRKRLGEAWGGGWGGAW